MRARLELAIQVLDRTHITFTLWNTARTAPRFFVFLGPVFLGDDGSKWVLDFDLRAIPFLLFWHL
jgi:hypothetical protein